MTKCTICGTKSEDKVNKLKSEGKGYRVISWELGLSQNSVRRHLKHAAKDATVILDDLAPVSGASLEFDGDEGSISTGIVNNPVSEWENVFEAFGLDPDVFEIIEPVRMSAWQGGQDGEMKYSYRARFKKKSVNPETAFDLTGWRQSLQSIEYVSTYPATKEDLSYVIPVADAQIGKPGLEETLYNWNHGIMGHFARINNLVESGYPIGNVVLSFMGDEHEAVVGNYVSQPYEVVLNMSQQLELDYDQRAWSIRALLDLGMPLTVTSVTSNHGNSWVRGPAKQPVTSDSDNSSTFVTKMLKKTFNSQNITWNIAAERDVVADISGVKTLFTHGHIEKGSGRGEQKVKNAMERQLLGRRTELHDVKIYVTAHYHHFSLIEDSGITYIGCPALEAEKSSEWFYSQYGVWSRPGMLGFLVGKSLGRRPYAEPQVI